MDEHHHVALPKLYGAPAYARPSVPHAQIERPFDPDDLPLANAMSEEDLEVLEQAAALEHEEPGPAPAPELTPRPFSVRAITERLGARRG
ncbi:MAG: hypothetical protein ABIQ17_05685 [Candidatus Limnocylindrales bacterium]